MSFSSAIPENLALHLVTFVDGLYHYRRTQRITKSNPTYGGEVHYLSHM